MKNCRERRFEVHNRKVVRAHRLNEAHCWSHLCATVCSSSVWKCCSLFFGVDVVETPDLAPGVDNQPAGGDDRTDDLSKQEESACGLFGQLQSDTNRTEQ